MYNVPDDVFERFDDELTECARTLPNIEIQKYPGHESHPGRRLTWTIGFVYHSVHLYLTPNEREVIFAVSAWNDIGSQRIYHTEILGNMLVSVDVSRFGELLRLSIRELRERDSAFLQRYGSRVSTGDSIACPSCHRHY